MRVLHVLHHIFHYACGYRTRSQYILRYQREQGIEVAVVTSADHEQGKERLAAEYPFPVFPIPPIAPSGTPGLREWRLIRSLERQVSETIRAWRPDIVHAHSPVLVGLPAGRAARKHGVPFVYEERDLWENASVDLAKFTERSVQYRAARALDTWTLRRADAVVAICEAMKRELSPRCGGEGRVTVVGNGVEMELFPPELPVEQGRRRWGLGGKRVIAYVGTFQPYEGLDLLFDALPAVVQAVPNAHLLIAGNGTQEEWLRSRSTEPALAPHVTMAGRLPHQEVWQAYGAADLMVYPRLLTRTTALTTPLKPLEAMAMGKAVLASDVPAMRELVKPGVSGELFEAGNGTRLAERCVELLGQDERRVALGATARDFVKRERQWGHLVSRVPGTSTNA